MEPEEVRRASEALRVRGVAAESPPEEVLEVEREKGTPGVSVVMVISPGLATYPLPIAEPSALAEAPFR